MSIWTINREQFDVSERFFAPDDTVGSGVLAGGTGLPFYLNQLSQSRYDFASTRNSYGGWMVPANKFPTWQLQIDVTGLPFSFNLVKASKDNDTPDSFAVELDFQSNFYKKCYNSVGGVNTGNLVVCDNRDRNMVLECGESYFFLVESPELYPPLYSELFTVYDYISTLYQCTLEGVITTIILNQASVDFTFNLNGGVNITGGTINGNPLTAIPQLFTLTLTANVPQIVTTEITTSNAGIFKQDFEVLFDGNTISLQITRIIQ